MTRSAALHTTAVVVRLAAAIGGGYAVTAGVAALAAVVLPMLTPMPRSEAVVLAAMLAFLLYLTLPIWAFRATAAAPLPDPGGRRRRVVGRRAGSGAAASGGLMADALLLLGVFATVYLGFAALAAGQDRHWHRLLGDMHCPRRARTGLRIVGTVLLGLGLGLALQRDGPGFGGAALVRLVRHIGLGWRLRMARLPGNRPVIHNSAKPGAGSGVVVLPAPPLGPTSTATSHPPADGRAGHLNSKGAACVGGLFREYCAPAASRNAGNADGATAKPAKPDGAGDDGRSSSPSGPEGSRPGSSGSDLLWEAVMTPALPRVLSRRLLCGLSLAAAAAGPLRAEPSAGPAWPHRPVRLMTSFVDRRSEAMARTLGAVLSARWRQPVMLDRRAAGTAPIEAVLAMRDDHVLLLAPTDLWTVPMAGGLFVHPARDLLPLASVAQDVIAVVAAAKSGLGTLEELVEAAHRRPGALTWTSVSPSPAFAFSSVLRATHAQLAFAPSRTPMAPLADLAQGRLDLALLPLPSAIEPARAGTIRLLAVTSTERAPAAPAVPTVAEAGYPALMTISGHGLFGVRDMSAPLCARIGQDVGNAVRHPVVAERLTRMGYRPWSDSPALFVAQLQREHARWSEMEPAYSITAAH